jgi:hypothetical protein
MTISYLADHPDFISVLAPEIAAHWQPYLPDETVEKRIAKLRAHLSTKILPIAWVAHNEGEVLGTAALRVHDLAGTMQLKRATDWEVIGIDEKEPIGGQQSASPIGGGCI